MLVDAFFSSFFKKKLGFHGGIKYDLLFLFLQYLCFVKISLLKKASIQSIFLWGPCSVLVTFLKGI